MDSTVLFYVIAYPSPWVAIQWMFCVIYYSTCTLCFEILPFGFAIQEMILFNFPICFLCSNDESLTAVAFALNGVVGAVFYLIFYARRYFSRIPWHSIQIFCMNVFHFSNIVIELDVLSTGKEVLMSVAKKNAQNWERVKKKLKPELLDICCSIRSQSFRFCIGLSFVRQFTFSFKGVEFHFIRILYCYVLHGMLQT